MGPKPLTNNFQSIFLVFVDSFFIITMRHAILVGVHPLKYVSDILHTKTNFKKIKFVPQINFFRIIEALQSFNVNTRAQDS